MQDHLRPRQKKQSFEINGKISEIFAEAALVSFWDERESNPLIEKKK
tara:strand:- start:573 stop:713 length:141 start_codon:yes stop_codon:yes gene_type:complete